MRPSQTCLLFLLLVTTTAQAQWVALSESNRTYTDFAIQGSVMVATNKGDNGEGRSHLA